MGEVNSFWPWLAGFFDGEGSFYCERRRDYYTVRLEVSQKDVSVLYYIKSLCGGNVVIRHRTAFGAVRPLGVWFIRGLLAYKIIANLWPHLKVKREQVINAILREIARNAVRNDSSNAKRGHRND